MSRALVRAGVFALIALAGCGGGAREYANSDLVLGPAHFAQDICSCVFVMNMPDDYCAAYSKVTPDLFRYSVDRANKTVEASALAMWGARAHWVSARQGCVLE